MSKTKRLKNLNQEEVAFYFNGEKKYGIENEPIASALLANNIYSIRTCDITNEPRGLYCGIGHCYECRAKVDGIPGVRTCLTPLKSDCEVNSQ